MLKARSMGGEAWAAECELTCQGDDLAWQVAGLELVSGAYQGPLFRCGRARTWSRAVAARA